MDFDASGIDEIMDHDMEQIVDQTHGDGGREQVPERSVDPVKHFGLSSRPFADCVNPELFYRTRAHEEVFISMKRCVEENVSLGLTTATSGTGKTLLTQVLIQQLDPRQYQTVLILAYPGMTRTALLHELAEEMKLTDQISGRPTTHALINTIQAHIIKLYLSGIRLVLIIDEVHFLNADSLHILRTLSNIEVPEQKLVSVLLFGEESFLMRQKQQTLKSVFSRMFVRAQIRPLCTEEVAQYIKFRLMMATGRPGLFATDAIAPIHQASQGIPREINRICHNALTLAARLGEAQVTAQTIARLAEERMI